MYGKILITCDLVVRTGLHIGAASGFSAIGAVDSPVVRDPLSGYPVVPGSSLKGKLRTLLARELAEDARYLPECKDDLPEIKELFGSTAKASLLQFSDCYLLNTKEMRKVGVTSIKAENCINRQTGKAANPRFIERVNPGARFAVHIVYNAFAGIDAPSTKKHLTLLAKAMCQLQENYLGGHGSRGSGCVSFTNFRLSPFPEGADVGKLEELFVPVEREDPFFNGETGADGGDGRDMENGGNSEEGGTA